MTWFYRYNAVLRTALVFVALLFLGNILPLARLQAQTCGCTNCPQAIADNTTVDLYVQVSNATNATLGQNGQGVCGVLLNFDHDYLGDLSIKLKSPTGQVVTLVGPQGFWGPTTFTNWNISFFQCGDVALPDGGFSATWNSDQIWGAAGNYNGSYYPFSGCLENLNIGPVNGTWTLIVSDAEGEDLGVFYDYQIIFCDPTGVACFSCLADAGNLLQPDVVACQGASSLKLSLPPTFPNGQTAPPSSDYSYKYIVAKSGGVIQSYLNTPDLSAFPAGAYTICGLSYLTSQASKVPVPNGMLTIQSLSTSLNSVTPPFCGDISTNCVNVTINSTPPNTRDTVIICYPDCYIFAGDTLCSAGIYSDTLDQAGCKYVVTHDLRVQFPDTVRIAALICANQCSTLPGFEQYCTTGIFTKTFQTKAGCDSTVILTLTVLDAQAQVLSPDTLRCNVPTVTLFGTGSSTGAGVTYHWSASNGGQLIGLTDQINATAAEPGQYQLKVCRTDVSGIACCDSVIVSVEESNAPPSVPGPIAGLAKLCLGQTAAYSIEPVPGASVYNWVAPNDVTIQSGQGDTSITILWNSAVPSVICVTAADACGHVSAPTCRTVLVGQVAPAAQVPQGPTKACLEKPEVYEIPPSGATDYVWTVNAPHSIGPGQGTPSVTINWGNAPTAQVCVKVTNLCGTSPAGCLNVSLGSIPSAPVLSGDTTVCRHDTITYTASPASGATGHTWVVSGGQILSGQGTDQVRVVWDGNISSSSICAMAQNVCGDSPQACLEVQVGTPALLGAVTRTCDAADLNYVVTCTVTGGTAPFSVTGGVVINGVFTSNPIPNSVPYLFVLMDANGCFSANIQGNYNCNCVSRAGQLGTQTLVACEGGMVTAQAMGAVTDLNDLSVFVMHSDSSAAFGTVFAQNSTGMFGLQSGMAYGVRYYISHLVGDPKGGLPDPDDPCYSISNIQPVIFYQNPVADAGPDRAVCGKTLLLAAVGSGSWTVNLQPPGSDLFLVNPQSPGSVANASLYGDYQLTWTVVGTGGCIGQDMTTLHFNELPMLDNLTRTCDAANDSYMVLLTLSGGAAPYTVNSNLIAGNTFMSSSFSNGQLFSFLVADANGCVMPLVQGAYDCSCTTDAGTMSAQLLSVCAGVKAQAQANQDLKPDPDDVVGFVLHDGSGPTLGKVFASNTSGAFAFQQGMVYGKMYYISRTLGNSSFGLPNPADLCFSVAPGQPVIFFEKPAPQAGKDTMVCGSTAFLEALKGQYDGQWSFVSGPGPAVLGVANDPKTSVQVSTAGTYIFQWTEQNAACSAADSIRLVFNAMPDIAHLTETCNGTNTGYLLQFDVVGGDAPYAITGVNGSFSGAAFTSVELPTNSNYLFFVTDANGCRTPETFGSHNCVCSTDAGTMQVVPPTTYCAGETVSAIWNNDPKLDANDIVEFILHDQPGSLVGKVEARNNQPVFAYQPSFQTGVVYYISAIAGNQVGGQVDLMDKCLSITPGVPVFWKALPTVEIDGADTICAGDFALLSISAAGAFPLKVTYTDGVSVFELPITGSQVLTLPVYPAATTTYQLLAATDGTNPTCSAVLMDAAVIQVNQPLEAGLPNGPLDLCEGTDLPIQLSNLLTDADFGGTWKELSSPPSLPGSFNGATGTLNTAGQIAGLYRFRYVVTSATPCPSDSAEVEVAIHRLPDAEAGENKALNCDQISVALDGSSTASDVRFIWFLKNDTVGITPQVLVQDSGRYVLVVTNPFGCTATDSVQVSLANQKPKATFLLKGVRCFGDSNGTISMDSLLVGEPPVLFALDGGVFSAQSSFLPVAPGPHTVTLLDANGCEWTSDTLLVPQPPPLVAELGADVRVHLGDRVVLTADLSLPPSALTSMVWKPLLDTAQAGTPIQRFTPLQSYRVTLQVVDTAGCRAEDQVWVLVDLERHIFIPNIIAPQSSENSIALIYADDDVEMVQSFQVFDRWGDLMFSKESFKPDPNAPSQGWDGRFKGELVLPGVYVYQATIRFVDGKTEAFFGSVTVIR